ncbi:GNAT family N-acetyltransferase [Ascidiimonas aurantiaca]|uniref:GNAT family N-acetyltransferase n=1 Tax=Ascidiimonas aurantiaca TaxID=1685432 RepID=UPI0030EBC4A4
MKSQITFEINKLHPNEVACFRDLVNIFKEVFENEEPISQNKQLGTLLSNPNFMVFVVRQNNKIVGGLTIHVLQSYYNTKPVAYIYDVGVTPELQGQGLGKALIAEVCECCKENGFEDAYVEAESDDIDAVNFYRKTKFNSETNAIHFTYTFDHEN